MSPSPSPTTGKRALPKRRTSSLQALSRSIGSTPKALFRSSAGLTSRTKRRCSDSSPKGHQLQVLDYPAETWQHLLHLSPPLRKDHGHRVETILECEVHLGHPRLRQDSGLLSRLRGLNSHQACVLDDRANRRPCRGLILAQSGCAQRVVSPADPACGLDPRLDLRKTEDRLHRQAILVARTHSVHSPICGLRVPLSLLSQRAAERPHKRDNPDPRAHLNRRNSRDLLCIQLVRDRKIRLNRRRMERSLAQQRVRHFWRTRGNDGSNNSNKRNQNNNYPFVNSRNLNVQVLRLRYTESSHLQHTFHLWRRLNRTEVAHIIPAKKNHNQMLRRVELPQPVLSQAMLLRSVV